MKFVGTSAAQYAVRLVLVGDDEYARLSETVLYKRFLGTVKSVVSSNRKDRQGQDCSPRLVRAMGRWTLAALILNSMIGSGIFGLPSILAGLVGRDSRWAFLVGGIGIGIIMACFAEVASGFDQSGGAYLYTRKAFGRFVGIEIGWITWLARLAAGAAGANLFVSYLAEFWPGAGVGLTRTLIITLLLAVLTVINYCGVKQGAGFSNLFTVAKLLPLIVFIVIGMFYLMLSGRAALLQSPIAHDSVNWLQALVLVVFAYGGFEGAVVSMGEVKNPQRDAPFGLFAALFASVSVYTLIQVIVIGVLPNPVAADRPLAAAAQQFVGKIGAWVMSGIALVSVYGNLSASMLAMPRLPFAMSEHGDLPQLFAAVHPRFRTPHLAILVWAGMWWILSIAGSFGWNARLSVVVRLLSYATVCASLMKLRGQPSNQPRFCLPAGRVVSITGVCLSLILVLRIGRAELELIAATFSLALLNWLWVLRRDREY